MKAYYTTHKPHHRFALAYIVHLCSRVAKSPIWLTDLVDTIGPMFILQCISLALETDNFYHVRGAHFSLNSLICNAQRPIATSWVGVGGSPTPLSMSLRSAVHWLSKSFHTSHFLLFPLKWSLLTLLYCSLFAETLQNLPQFSRRPSWDSCTL